MSGMSAVVKGRTVEVLVFFGRFDPPLSLFFALFRLSPVAGFFFLAEGFFRGADFWLAEVVAG